MKQNKKRKIIFIIAAVLILSGLGVLLYPQFTAFLYRQDVAKQKEIFLQQIQAGNRVGEESPGFSPDLEALYQELKRQNEKLFEEKQKDLNDPFSYQQPAVSLAQYGLTDNVIGFLSIEKMGIELPIYLGANEQNLSLGAAHLTETSYPIGGENTNCVLAAHRGFSKAPMFRQIQLLEPGDVVTIQNFRETLRYQVVQTEVILPTQVDHLLIQPGRDMLTLITCHPYPTNTHRYVVYCQRIGEEE